MELTCIPSGELHYWALLPLVAQHQWLLSAMYLQANSVVFPVCDKSEEKEADTDMCVRLCVYSMYKIMSHWKT